MISRKYIILLVIGLLLIGGFSQAQSILPTDTENLAAELDNRNLGHLTRAYGNNVTDVIGAWNAIRESVSRGDITLDNLPFVTFGLIDTGVDIPAGDRHPEFDGIAFSPSTMTDDSDNDPNTPGNNGSGHGTLVAGIIGADNDSAFGSYNFPEMNGLVSGITDNYGFIVGKRDEIPVSRRFLNLVKVDTFLNMIRPMPTGTIVNVSFGATKISGVNDAEFAEFREAYIEGMRARDDMLFVMSAGNRGVDAIDHVPGGIDEPNAITVAALAFDLNANPFVLSSSNYGTVDIAAPGANIFMPARRPNGVAPLGGDPAEDNYVFSVSVRGTSFAAPFVTGTAGLLKALENEYRRFTPSLVMDPPTMKNLLTISAEPIDTGEPGKSLGDGCGTSASVPNPTGCRLNAHRAVVWFLPPTPVTSLTATVQ